MRSLLTTTFALLVMVSGCGGSSGPQDSTVAGGQDSSAQNATSAQATASAGSDAPTVDLVQTLLGVKIVASGSEAFQQPSSEDQLQFQRGLEHAFQNPE